MTQYSRRRFLATGFKTGLFLTVLSPFKNLFANHKSIIKYPQWNDLVEVARWCPTVHNLQPHKLRVISDTEAELYVDQARLLSVEDPENIFTIVALGIFVEHLSIAASVSGVKVEISQLIDQIDSKAKDLCFFARLQMTERLISEEIDPKYILKRRTSRIHYNGKAIKQELLNKLGAEALKFDHKFYSSDKEELIDSILNLNQETLFEDLGSKEVREELDQLFRYDEDEAKTKKDGLWAKCMGFKGSLMRSVFKNHGKWEKGIRKKILGKYYRHSFKGTATMCWFAGRFDTINDWLNAGKMLARNWLLITKNNAYIQPFGSLITNPEAYKRINEKFEGTNEDKRIWMIFRAGYSKEPTRSFRLDTDQIIIK